MEINVPLLYYKGYTAKIESKSGEIAELEVTKNKENGFVLVKGDKDLSGKITIEYSLTIIQIISYIVSIISLVGVIGYIIYDKKKNR